MTHGRSISDAPINTHNFGELTSLPPNIEKQAVNCNQKNLPCLFLVSKMDMNFFFVGCVWENSPLKAVIKKDGIYIRATFWIKKKPIWYYLNVQSTFSSSHTTSTPQTYIPSLQTFSSHNWQSKVFTLKKKSVQFCRSSVLREVQTK